MSSRSRSAATDEMATADPHWFVKCDPCATEAVEKYNWLNAVAKSNGFQAPRGAVILRDGRQWVSLEFIPGFVPLQDLYIRHLLRKPTKPPFLSIMRDAGRALGAIHAAEVPRHWTLHPLDSKLQDEARRYGLRSSTDAIPVPLHGDFGQMNVGIASATGATVVLDPCANVETTVGGHLVYGDPAIDLGQMLAFLEGELNSPAILLATPRRVCKAQVAFIEGYAEIRPEIDLESAFAYSSALMRLRMQSAGLLRSIVARMLYNPARRNSTLQSKLAYFRRYASV